MGKLININYTKNSVVKKKKKYLCTGEKKELCGPVVLESVP